MYVCTHTVAQFCVNNWGDDIPARRQQFWGGYKLLYSTLLSLGDHLLFPQRIAPLYIYIHVCIYIHIYIYIYIYFVCIYVSMYVHVCMCVSMYECIYMCVCMYI